jgi:uncharacterized protein
MEFEFDPAKDAINLAKHQLSLQFGALLFLDPMRIEWQDRRVDYQEVRMVTVGFVESYFFTALYTPRGVNKDIKRIFSVRRASKNDRAKYKRINQLG